MTNEPVAQSQSAPGTASPDSDLRHDDELDGTGVRMLVLGAIVAVLAPLGGFLGGSISGSSLDKDLDPLFVWLFSGLVIGGVGAVVAFVGGLRWFRANRGRL